MIGDSITNALGMATVYMICYRIIDEPFWGVFF